MKKSSGPDERDPSAFVGLPDWSTNNTYKSPAGLTCPSSDDLGHERLISNGGSGSFGLQSMPLSGDAASGASRLSLL